MASKTFTNLNKGNSSRPSTIGIGTGYFIIIKANTINLIKVNKALKEKRVALNEEDAEFFFNEEINFEEYKVVNSSMIARERKKLGNSIKNIIL